MFRKYQFFQILLFVNHTAVFMIGMHIEKKGLNELVYNVENEKLIIANRTLKNKAVTINELGGDQVDLFYKSSFRNSQHQILYGKNDLVRTANSDFSWENLQTENAFLGFLYQFFEIFNETGSKKFLFISIVVLFICSIILILVIAVIVFQKIRRRNVKNSCQENLKPKFLKRPESTNSGTKPRSARDSNEISKSKDKKLNRIDELDRIQVLDKTNCSSKNDCSINESGSLLYKCRKQKKPLSSYNSCSSLSDINIDSTAYLINCTNCFTRSRRKSKKISTNKPKLNNPRIVISPTSSCENNQNIVNLDNGLKKAKKKKKSQTQFLIKFHQFSLRSPSSNNTNKSITRCQNSVSNINLPQNTPMNQRCCLSVSVVPSDKQNSKSANSRKKNKSRMQDDDELSDSYSRELPTDQNNKLNAQKKNLQTNSKPELATAAASYISSQNLIAQRQSLTKYTNASNSNSSSTSSIGVIPHSTSSNFDSNCHKPLKNQQLLAERESMRNSSPSISEPIYREPPYKEIHLNEITESNNECIYIKANDCQDSENISNDRFSVCSLVSSSTVKSQQEHCKKFESSESSDNTFTKDDTTSISSTLTTSSTKTNSSYDSNCTEHDMNVNLEDLKPSVDELLSIDCSGTNSKRVAMPQMRHNNYDYINGSYSESRTSMESCGTNNGEREVFNLGLRLNKLRFIDDSASSTALTSPCESSSHIYGGSIKSFTNSNARYFHKQQQQHRYLNASNYAHVKSTSSSTSSSRTVSQQPSTNTSCNTTACSTPVHLSACNPKEQQRLYATTRNMPIQRQQPVVNNTNESACSSSSEHSSDSRLNRKPKSSINLPKNLTQHLIQQKIKKEIKSQQFQHEQLSDDYRKHIKTQHLTSSVQSTEDDDEIKKIILKTHCDNFNNRKNSLSSSSTTSTSSSITNAHMNKNKYYHCKKNFVNTNQRLRVNHKNQQQSPSFNSSFTSSTATPESSSSEYENCAYIAKPKNPSFVRVNDSANESISSIDGYTNGCEQGNSCKHCKPVPKSIQHLKKNNLTWTSSTPIMQKVASNDVYQNNSSTEPIYLAYGFNQACSSNNQPVKSKNDDQIYTYDNFDSINECIEENNLDCEKDSHYEDLSSNSHSIKVLKNPEHIIENNTELKESDTDSEEYNDKCNFTSNLVEDGFIRMSSPVDEDLIDLSDADAEELKNNITADQEYCFNDMNQLSNELVEVFDSGKKILGSNATNFPNVGSSPVSEEFHDTDASSSENEEDIEEAKACDSEFDGIIFLSDSINPKESASLSDEEILNGDFEDNEQNDLPVHSQKSQPHSIMKSSSKYKATKENIEEYKIDHKNGSWSSTTNSPNTNIPSSIVGNNLLPEAKVANLVSTKPKVRFNLDINYEKEREWNRVNRIIGDASKSQIEWTQEVEV